MRLFFLFVVFLVGCTAVTAPVPTPILPAGPTAVVPAASPTPLVPDTGWEAARPGLERRVIRFFDADGRLVEHLYILRFDPALYQFRVGYRPGEPLSLQDWQAETGALAVLNGGFFTEEFTATGLVVVDGQASGASYGAFAGMFAVTAVGPEVRWLGARPHDPNESLQYALQSFPVLVKPGGAAGYAEPDGEPARRAVVGQDGDGRILFILAPRGRFTLTQLSQTLAASDLNLDTAVNLDGGASAGLILTDPPASIPAYTLLPAVILVYGR
ncbi:MAG TPA: phosphodiester glycosidase family protein [Anaerolineae bacterium]|nr:phosphodiester glycosidase family protein [Anaerolineae bacterium]